MFKDFILSIYIPAYNHSKTIDNSLSFIASELRKNNLKNEVEIVISDNASSDDTQIKVKKFIVENSDINLFYSCNSENIGGIKNIMHLWGKTKGDYVMMIGDDCFAPSALLNIINSIKENESADIIVLKNNQYNDFDYNSNASNFDIVKHIRKLQYIGNFVLRRSHFGENFNVYEKYCDNSFPHLAMILERLSSANKVIDIRFTAINVNSSWNYEITTKVIFKLDIDCFKIVKMMRSSIGEESHQYLIKYYSKLLYNNLRFIRGHKDRFNLCSYILQEIPYKNPKIVISLVLHSLPAPFFYSFEAINSIFRNMRRCKNEIIANRKKWKTEKFKKYQNHVSDDFGVL